jgi:exodeoxyribonuclease V alpha subunit
MSAFEHWPTLHVNLKQGSLSFVDLAFATSVLKKLGSEKEEHAALLCLLFALMRNGHLALDISHQTLFHALQLLGIKNMAAFAELVHQGAASFPVQGITETSDGNPKTWLCRSGSMYYLQKNWIHESEILTALQRLKSSPPSIALEVGEVDPLLNETQKRAVELGMQNALSFLSGGPGTGKTFTAAAFVKACLALLNENKKSQFRIILTAPTGKAVAQLEANLRKSLSTLENVHAGTLHAILKIKMHSHEEDQVMPLFADLIIVDECSMIDAKIFSRLLRAVNSGTRLLLIGDKDQLPPVEAGSIFADILDSKAYPVTHLWQCLRSDRSSILELARHIKEGDHKIVFQILSEKTSSDIEWIDLQEGPRLSTRQCNDLWDSCKDRFPSFHPTIPDPAKILNEIGRFSLLSCMRQGSLGVDFLNRYFLHQYLRQATHGSWWVLPIMITRNDYEMELYNGDMGFLIRQITPEFSLGQFTIDDYALFLDRKGGYRQISALALPSFEYSYCLSVHKSQGSEYDEIFVLAPQGSELFGREVLYTAVTRAKHKITLAANKEMLSQAIANSSQKMSGLRARLSTTFLG